MMNCKNNIFHYLKKKIEVNRDVVNSTDFLFKITQNRFYSLLFSIVIIILHGLEDLMYHYMFQTDIEAYRL